MRNFLATLMTSTGVPMIVAGDELTATTRVDAIRQAGGHSMITVVTDLADAGGAPVCTASSTIVVRGGE